ncbi:MAG TPA: FAD/NAD(P)-binding protein [Vineibacter sp.]|nr:FAD/NAD(P)-binding protein [Vineibacter sp.]
MTIRPRSAHTVSIIGGGFSGTLAAIKLINAATQPLLVRIIEPRTELGRGLAYSTRQAAHLVNGPAKLFGLHPDQPDHFARWLADYGASWGWRDPLDADYANAFAPRWVLGLYVQAELAAAVAQAAPGVSLEHIVGEARDVWRNGDALSIALGDGRVLVADHVVLALGVFQAQPEFSGDPSLLQSGRYIEDPWNIPAYDAVPPQGDVALIGSGLTMLDAVVTLERRGFRGRYHAISRRGLLVQPRREVSPWRDFLAEGDLPRTAVGLLRRIRVERTSVRQAGADWQSLIAAIRPHVGALWQGADETERSRFLRHLRPFWENAMHRAPGPSARLLDDVRAAGRFVHRAARVQDLQFEPSGRVAVALRPRGSDVRVALTVDTVINCTGAHYEWSQAGRRPLVANLLRRGLVRPGPLAFGIDADPHAAVVERDGAASDRLSAIGPPLRGSRWESSTNVELLQQAIALATRLNDSIVAPAEAVAAA